MTAPESKPQGSEQPDIERAIAAIRNDMIATTSFLQRRLRWGFARANRVLQELCEQGFIEPTEKSYVFRLTNKLNAPLPNPSADEEVETPLVDAAFAEYPVMDTQRGGDAITIQAARAIEKQLRQQHNAERERIVRECREAVRKRNNQIDELTGKLSHLRESHAELKSIYDETENERQRFLSELQQLRASLAEKDKEIQELRKSLEAEIAERDYLRTQLGGEFK